MKIESKKKDELVEIIELQGEQIDQMYEYIEARKQRIDDGPFAIVFARTLFLVGAKIFHATKDQTTLPTSVSKNLNEARELAFNTLKKYKFWDRVRKANAEVKKAEAQAKHTAEILAQLETSVVGEEV